MPVACYAHLGASLEAEAGMRCTLPHVLPGHARKDASLPAVPVAVGCRERFETLDRSCCLPHLWMRDSLVA